MTTEQGGRGDRRERRRGEGRLRGVGRWAGGEALSWSQTIISTPATPIVPLGDAAGGTPGRTRGGSRRSCSDSCGAALGEGEGGDAGDTAAPHWLSVLTELLSHHDMRKEWGTLGSMRPCDNSSGNTLRCTYRRRRPPSGEQEPWLPQSHGRCGLLIQCGELFASPVLLFSRDRVTEHRFGGRRRPLVVHWGFGEGPLAVEHHQGRAGRRRYANFSGGYAGENERVSMTYCLSNTNRTSRLQ